MKTIARRLVRSSMRLGSRPAMNLAPQLLLALGAAMLAFEVSGGEPGPGALANVLAQIAALQQEARALSPAQKKIATPLQDALREFRGAAPRAYAPKLRSNQELLPGARVLVDIRGRVSDGLLAHLQGHGANIRNSHPQYESIRAEVPIAALEIIAAHADVNFIRPASIPTTNVGTATSEGFYAETVDLAQSHFGVTGAGVTVGVLSDSVRYLTKSLFRAGQ
jgi:hypothetical protein